MPEFHTPAEIQISKNAAAEPAPAQNPNSRLQLIVMVVAFVLFVLSLGWGIFSGFAYAKSVATYNNVDILNTALGYYFKDQGVYPTADQFYNQQVLRLLYLNGMPKPEDASGACSAYTDFVYTQTNPKNFSLKFCLLQGVHGWPAGVNVLSSQ